MHVFSITLALAVVCASALPVDPIVNSPEIVGHDGVPQYANARKLADQAIDKVRQLIYTKDVVDDNLPSAKRNYAILIAVLDKLASKLRYPGPFYDEIYYEVVNDVVPNAWMYPDKVRDSFARQVDTFIDVTMPLRQVIDKYCSNEETVKCDKAVDLVVQAYPEKYGKSKEFLLKAAELAKTYMADTRESYAKNNQIITYLLTDGKDDLNDIVFKYAALKAIKL